MQIRADETRDGRHIRLAESSGRFDQRVENGLKIESRAADHLEHVGGGGLLLEGFTKFIEQANVLDGDHGLVSEGLDQFNLLLTEAPRLITNNSKDADDLPLAHEGHPEPCSHADHVGRVWFFVFGVDQEIRNVDRAALDERAPENRSSIRYV